MESPREIIGLEAVEIEVHEARRLGRATSVLPK